MNSIKLTKRLLVPVVFLALVMLAGLASVYAFHDDLIFELDEDAIHETGTNIGGVGTGPADDWDQICRDAGISACSGVTGTSNPLASVFVQDGDDFSGGVTVPAGLPTHDTSYFTTGGSKDVNDMNQWRHQTGDVSPDKDEILNAYAAAYAGGKIYFGLDRLANNGDAQVGFWFFQKPICQRQDGTGLFGVESGGVCSGTATHDVGDILVLSHFTGGGSVDTIFAFKWVGPPDADNLLEIAEGVDCATAVDADGLCASVNGPTGGLDTKGTQDAPWPYVSKFPKKGQSENDFAPGTFFEGAIDLAAFGLADICFSSFLAETRSSQSLDAQLKDKAEGSFDICAIEVEKTGDALSKIGDPVTYTYEIFNRGGVTLHLQSIIDTGDNNNGAGLGDLSADAPPACDTLTPDDLNDAGGTDQCSFTKGYTVLAGDDDPLDNTVTVVYDSKVTLDGSEVTDDDPHSVNLFQPSLTLTKTGDTLSKVGDEVNYTIEVCNTSSLDTPALQKVSVTDSLTGPALSPDVNGAFGASLPATNPDTCESHNFTRTVQAGDPDPLVNTATAHYNPDGFENDISDSDDHSVNLVHPGLAVAKDCAPPTAFVGSTITYTCTINNTGDVQLDKVSIIDSLVGNITNSGIPNQVSHTCGATLAATTSCTISYTRVILSTDDNPLVNVVTATYQVNGLPNILEASDNCSVDITFGEGCTPGFWKTHESLWDGAGGDDLTSTIQTTDGFNATFGVTAAQSGLDNSVTLLDALSVSGSELNALNRHAAAGLASADSGIDYTFTVAAVIALYRDAVGADPGPETVTSAHAKLKAANELNCPLS